MNDSNDNNNPFKNREADKENNEVTREDSYWSSNQENALYDCYLMLRDAGYSKDELDPLGEMLNRTTVFSQENAEEFYNQHVKE